MNTEANHDVHFRTTLRELYLRESKGSKIFRGVFNYDSPVESINTHLKRWEELLPGYKICPGEIKCTYQSLQNKYFPKHLLDMRTRLILRKTQFNNTLSKWTKDNITEICHMCQARGDYSRGTLVHTLFECCTVKEVILHVMWNITLQEHVSPIEVILTNNRCLKVVNGRGKPIRNRPIHDQCAVKKDYYDTLALDLIWCWMTSSILDCVNLRDEPNENIPNKHAIATRILTEMDHYIKYKPDTPLGMALKKN